MSFGVGGRCGLDLALLWLWRRPAATALIRPLAWKSPYAAGAALKSKRKTKKTKQNKTKQNKNLNGLGLLWSPFSDEKTEPLLVLLAIVPGQVLTRQHYFYFRMASLTSMDTSQGPVKAAIPLTRAMTPSVHYCSLVFWSVAPIICLQETIGILNTAILLHYIIALNTSFNQGVNTNVIIVKLKKSFFQNFKYSDQLKQS